MFELGPVQDVDYEATLATKLSIAKKVFVQEKDLILNSRSFQKYFSENEVLQTYVFFFLWSCLLHLKYFDLKFELWSFLSLIILSLEPIGVLMNVLFDCSNG